MISKSMQRFLETGLKTKPQGMRTDRWNVQRFVYMSRIQKRIDVELDALLWLCINRPEVFLYEGTQKTSYNKNERFKKLLLTIKALQGEKIDVELVKPIEPEQSKPKISEKQATTANQKRLFERIKRSVN
jgi:hypothetical protein